MNKTRIDWCDMTWNPVTGCLHECEYCYAKSIARRFQGKDGFIRDYGKGKVHEIDVPALRKSKKDAYVTAPYPFGFEPTFHRYRLIEPQEIKKPQTIFVCSMADLFGAWVPDKWIEQVFKACEKTPQHRYMFLTKNPFRYMQLYESGKLPCKDNMWYGSTVVDSFSPYFIRTDDEYKTFVSVEPIMESIPSIECYGIERSGVDWVIVGAETGNQKEKCVPKKDWIDEIANDCKKFGVPVFMKESLRVMMGEEFVQEFPW